jgi:hypothetical protein
VSSSRGGRVTRPETLAQAAASVVAASVTPQAVQKAPAATVLWVDDDPDNNIYVRRSLEALSVRFVIAT